MKKYVVIRFLLIFVNIFLIGTILYVGLTYANFMKYTNLSFRQVSPIVWRLYKNYIENRTFARRRSGIDRCVSSYKTVHRTSNKSGPILYHKSQTLQIINSRKRGAK